ncbi:DUF1788 domain-containing protein [Clostridium sp. FP2]|uniref:BREX protein BrxB domain-containing protein n=1 Tax=Clostridium sp. FP2 TaxID=2724481 RepID=UPI0013E922C9|nr:BREX protein BrxB domain-containing protein [Clostridium sp. FP2]MBZ9624418.1 DUF1788 domain-containing protein [Clostridium sp. FP2]
MDELYDFIHSDKFLQGIGLANEMPYYIFDYNPKEELRMRKEIEFIIEKSKLKILEIDLFQITWEIFKDEDMEEIFECEKNEGIRGVIKDIIAPVIEEGCLIDLIVSKAEGYEILFINGVGSVFQFLRLHEVFSKLGDRNIKMPVVGFYPGTYTTEVLNLFNIIESKNYYRAFKINY